MNSIKLILIMFAGLLLAGTASAEECYRCVPHSDGFRCEDASSGGRECHVIRGAGTNECRLRQLCPKDSAILDKVDNSKLVFQKRLILEIAKHSPRMALCLYRFDGEIVSEAFPAQYFWMPFTVTLDDVRNTLEMGDEYDMQGASPEVIQEVANGKRQPIVYDIVFDQAKRTISISPANEDSAEQGIRRVVIKLKKEGDSLITHTWSRE